MGNKIQYFHLFILFFFAEKQKYSILQRELFIILDIFTNGYKDNLIRRSSFSVYWQEAHIIRKWF